MGCKLRYQTQPVSFTVVHHQLEKSGSIELVTCYLKYVIDPYKLDEFGKYARMWIPLVNKFGGIHHGYFLPSEGANNMALALFTFPGLAEYEKYRSDSLNDADCIAAFKYAGDTKCILSYERSFFKPVFE